MKFKYYAIDFDGTIVTEVFPAIGELLPHAIRVMNRIKDNGGQIAIWTARSKSQNEKVQTFLAENNIPYDVYNEPFEDIKQKYEATSNKIFADLYIDDRDIHLKARGRGIDWLEIEQLIFEEGDV